MQYKARMVHADQNYWMDMQILKALSGSVGASSLYKRFKELLPSASIACDLKSTWAKASELVSLESFKWASTTTQGHLNAAIAMLNELLRGICPTPMDTPPAFITEVRASLQYFCRVDLTAAENEKRCGTKEPTHLAGHDAVQYKWGRVQAKDKKQVKLPELEELTTFSWLLSSDDQTRLTEKVVAVHELLNVVTVEKKRASKMSDGKATKKPRASDEGKKCAAALFQ
eukprot:6490302-Amphidinium_carterae.6